MYVENTFIPELKLIHLDEFIDIRGSFTKVFNEDFYQLNGLETNFKESYFSISAKNVIRGMHFQIPPFEHIKLVYLNHGKIIDVVLDIRKFSPTFGKHFTIELNTKKNILVYIPVGCAHGFLSLEDNSMITYIQSSCYDKDSDKGIKYNSFGMNWGLAEPILSERDLNFPDFSNYNYNF